MGTHKMIVSPPPLQLRQEVWGLLGCRPGATGQRCYPMPDGEIHSLDKSSVYPSREAQSLQDRFESDLCPQAQHVGDPYQSALSVASLHLAVDQACLHLPPAHLPPATTPRETVAKVGRERIKIQIEPVTGKERKAARSQESLERVDEPMRHGLRAGTELQHGKHLGEGINGQPEPEDLSGAA